jgi:putative FmdB family regulatory protein
MPMYEYRCDHCGEEFEELVFHGIPDRELTCPVCELSGSVTRKLSTFASPGAGGHTRRDAASIASESPQGFS